MNGQIGRGTSWIEDVLSLLGPVAKHWKLLLIGPILVALLTFVGSRFVKNEYQSSGTVVFRVQGSSMGLAGLGSLMGGDLGSILNGKSGVGSQAPLLRTYLGTQALRESAMARFPLLKLWKIDTTRPVRWEDLHKTWLRNLTWMETDDDAIVVGFQSTDSVVARDVVGFVIAWMDSALAAHSRKKASEEVQFLNGRIREREMALDSAQAALIRFQKRNKMFVPIEQMQQTVRMAAELETTVQKLDLEMEIEKARNGSAGSAFQTLERTRRETAKLLGKQMGSAGAGEPVGLVTRSIPNGLDLVSEYARLMRTVEVHKNVLIYLIQSKEQNDLERNKNLPSLVVVDPPQVPAKKFYPPRATLTILSCFLSFVFLAIGSFFFEYLKSNGITLGRLKAWLDTGTWSSRSS